MELEGLREALLLDDGDKLAEALLLGEDEADGERLAEALELGE